jgi:hypothetical protein
VLTALATCRRHLLRATYERARLRILPARLVKLLALAVEETGVTAARAFIPRRTDQLIWAAVAERFIGIATRLAQVRWVLVPLLGAVMGRNAPGLGPADMPYFDYLGRAILDGHLGVPYASDLDQSGPFQLLVASPYPHHMIKTDSSLIVIVTIWGFIVAPGAMLAIRLLRRHYGLAPSALHELAGGLATALWLIGGNLFVGHLAESAIPTFWVAAAMAARRGHPLVAGLLVGSSAGWEPWGLLGIPIALLVPRFRDGALAVLACIVTASLCYVPFVLSGHFAMFQHKWPIVTGTFVHWLMPHTATFGWLPRLAQSSLAVAAGAAVAIAVRRRANAVWLVPLMIVLVRLMLDPTDFVYYWVAAQVAVLAGAATLEPRQRLKFVLFLATAWFTSATWGPFEMPDTVLAIVTTILLTIVECRSPLTTIDRPPQAAADADMPLALATA